jgi:hypothetical protein
MPEAHNVKIVETPFLRAGIAPEQLWPLPERDRRAKRCQASPGRQINGLRAVPQKYFFLLHVA